MKVIEDFALAAGIVVLAAGTIYQYLPEVKRTKYRTPFFIIIIIGCVGNIILQIAKNHISNNDLKIANDTASVRLTQIQSLKSEINYITSVVYNGQKTTFNSGTGQFQINGATSVKAWQNSQYNGVPPDSNGLKGLININFRSLNVLRGKPQDQKMIIPNDIQ